MDPAVVVASLSLAVAIGSLYWSRHTWKAARTADVRVIAHAYSGSARIYRSGQVEDVQYIVAVRVFNRGERSAYVMWTGLHTISGTGIADDRPSTADVLDHPPLVPREIPPQGQLFTQFKLAASELDEGFVGYAVLATDETIYSVPAILDSEFDRFGAALAQHIRERARGGNG